MKQRRGVLLLAAALLISVKTSVSFDGGQREADSATIISQTFRQELQRIIGRIKDTYSVMSKRLRSRNRRTAVKIRGNISDERKRSQNSIHAQNKETAQKQKKREVRRYLRNNRRKRLEAPQYRPTQEYDRVRNSLDPALRALVTRSDNTEHSFLFGCVGMSGTSEHYAKCDAITRQSVLQLRRDRHEEQKWLTDTSVRDDIGEARKHFASYKYLRPGRYFYDKFQYYASLSDNNKYKYISKTDTMVALKHPAFVLYERIIAQERTILDILANVKEDVAFSTSGTGVTVPPSTRIAPTAPTPPTNVVEKIKSYWLVISIVLGALSSGLMIALCSRLVTKSADQMAKDIKEGKVIMPTEAEIQTQKMKETLKEQKAKVLDYIAKKRGKKP